ncbi:unnamed protein product [Vitrella brassicaformis CCMP3155]|uniref:Vesicle-trafficking protein SEC22b n=1 Tax=Vitrella brassicaformis (strain CCMP3155) TaxID=1169540 RepID=A0A0G4EQV4_VITBC|nr:unnamed protein product [Vitrella brassicaformis CCMP3155]|mmetsp:Transcript_2073/g.4674  ORF Transcript_2073/g.4674 Transcript_2073/m.4674 type:complete len:229 (-) Transcript_2073:276-962(-)|eukprot:CEL99858.1 unnamed protein product [Vitrella brassicaformis CCMP3155]
MPRLTFIARATDGLILVETWDDINNNKSLQTFKQQAKQLLKKLDQAPPRCSVDSSTHTFHYLCDSGICYMTLCEKSYPKKLAFSFLEEIHRAFQEELKREFGTHSVDYRSQIETVEKPYYFIKFDRTIQRKKMEYRDPRSNKALQKLNDSLTEVASIMRQNIDEVLQRGENLEDVGRKATSLKYESDKFRKAAHTLNLQALARQYAPLLVIGGVIFLFIVYKVFSWTR